MYKYVCCSIQDIDKIKYSDFSSLPNNQKVLLVELIDKKAFVIKIVKQEGFYFANIIMGWTPLKTIKKKTLEELKKEIKRVLKIELMNKKQQYDLAIKLLNSKIEVVEKNEEQKEEPEKENQEWYLEDFDRKIFIDKDEYATLIESVYTTEKRVNYEKVNRYNFKTNRLSKSWIKKILKKYDIYKDYATYKIRYKDHWNYLTLQVIELIPPTD